MEIDAKSTEMGIYERIWAAIAERKLPPGTRLKEERLCEIFNVSRPRIRRALDQLGHDGLVKHIPHRGAFVATPSIDEARDVLYTRQVIEPGILRALTERITPNKIKTLRDHVAQEREAHSTGENAAIIRLSGAFHLLLAELAETPILTDVLRDLVSKSTLVTAVYQPKSVSQCGPDEHEDIIHHLQQGDTLGAIASMDHHLRDIETQLNLAQSADDAKLQADLLSNAFSEDT
ncbi:GntR family transcriptional regulator [Parasedimentitalea psychrophila]|uniref:GntR family transcriptional regulator n=1 Tax=Parasedimentitalea psychrophila TaxID=2997337 RepID=A0A9Y2KZ78_9RHOB|nr:GntR family transcriptional regulator [Parasedimentitalea psychrophila]WIY25826.1 GntR family transcriptional regulator [Parasedimentitalea psychrophila]